MASTTNLNRHLESLGLTLADLPSPADARRVWSEFRTGYGFKATSPRLLAPGAANWKIAKNAVPTVTLTLTPADLSGRWNVCTWSTPQCRKACVMWTAGRQYHSVRQGRLVRTAFLAEHPAEFLSILTDEVARIDRKGQPFGLRLNVGSDIRWEVVAPWIFDFANVRAYDYTKAPMAKRNVPANYRLTFSHTERWTDADVLKVLMAGHNVAMVFDAPKHNLPATHLGMPVIDGDLTDYRYADPVGVIVGLAAKGAAKAMKSADTGQFVTIGKAA